MNKIKGKGTVLLAPNGKPSNLTPKQWHLVRTQNFIEWFGDWENDPANASKVVDENGEPLVVYHGTQREFYIFEPNKNIQKGIFFTNDYDYANWRSEFSDYANKGDKKIILSCFLSLKEPEIKDKVNVFNYEIEDEPHDSPFIESSWIEDAKKYKYDGMIIKAKLYNNYIAFYPNQIKLADGTNTTFDSNNPDIRYEEGGKLDDHEETYKKWKSLVNMSKSELENFYNSEEGKKAGLSSSEAKSLGIHSGRESARWIMKMKDTPKSEWTPTMWKWAKRQISFISRMSGNKGGLYDDKGNKTRKHTSLLIWGHNPEKHKSGGTIAQTPAPKKERIYGSQKNKPESSKDTKSAERIEFNEKTLETIKNKVAEHNEKHPNKKVTLASAKAVVRRGMGAYSSTHRPTIKGGKPNSRVAWGLARLNAFLYKVVKGKSKSGKYSQDNDLLDELGIKHQKFENGGLAPNGKQSNLTPEQWHLVRTPEFKAWFGDWENDPANASKVVDENGEPLVCYHGTKHQFTIFRDYDVERNTMGNSVGMYFTPNELAASRIDWQGNYIKVFLNIRNLVSLRKFTNDDFWFNLLGNDLKNARGLPDRAESYWFLKNGSAYRGKETDNVGDVVKELSLKKGINGYLFPERLFNDIPEIDVYVCFDSNQIKLADGTNTTFDSSNPDIRFDEGGRVEDFIREGIVDLKMYDTTPEHAKEYGLDSVNPLYVQSIYISENQRLKGIGKQVLAYIEKYAIENGHDVVFGHINQKAEPSVDVIKSMLVKSGFNTCEGNNDFYRIIGVSDIRYGKGGLVAPNGKPSNLTPEQYKLVRTPEFKAWFGDWENSPETASKVVDENGEPLPVYHGSRSEFNVFDIKKSGASNTTAKVGFWFTPIKRFAENFASTIWYGKSENVFVYSVFLSIKKPKIYESEIVSEEKKEELRLQIKELQNESLSIQKKWVEGNFDYKDRMVFDYSIRGMINDENYNYYSNLTNKSIDAINDGILISEINKKKQDIENKIWGATYTDSYQKYKTDIYKIEGKSAEQANTGGLGMALNDPSGTINKYVQSLTENKYDGIIIRKTRFDKKEAGGFNDQYVTLLPNQIKLADGTNTTFDSTNPDIRFAGGGVIGKSRSMIPNVRGGWTKDKILRYLKEYDSDTISTYNLTKFISDLNNWQELKSLLYYHGTANYIERGLKPSIVFSEKVAESIGGGGYGQRYWGISLTKRKRTAESFSGMSRSVTIYPVFLKKDAVVIERTDISDSSEIEDIIVELYEKGIDAVWIGGGEEELVVVNPRSIMIYKKGSDSYNVYGGLKSKNLTDEEIENIYQNCKSKWSEYYKIYTESDKDNPELFIKSLEPIKFIDGGSVLLAPNGKPSNLTPEQYRLVRTAEFKAWFGDWENDPKNASKVVDENGEPLVCYHGTNKEFNIFKPLYDYEDLKIKYWLTPELNYAKGFGSRLIEAFVDIKKPKYNNQNIKINEIYDGYIEENRSKIYFLTVVSSNQIKLADGSNTTFDAENPDIRYDEGGEIDVLLAPNGKPSNLTPEQYKLVRTPEFKAWFGDWENYPENASKIIDENGEPMVVYHGTDAYPKFNIFNVKNLGFYGRGAYFTENYEEAKAYSGVEFGFDEKEKELIKQGFGKVQKPTIYIVFLNIRKPYYAIKQGLIKKEDYKKYDGIFVDNYDKRNDYITFNPNQIKLADGTNTTFDANNADIRYAEGGRIIKSIIGSDVDLKGDKKEKWMNDLKSNDTIRVYKNESLSTNSIYYTISRGSKQIKIRISDHDSSLTRDRISGGNDFEFDLKQKERIEERINKNPETFIGEAEDTIFVTKGDTVKGRFGDIFEIEGIYPDRVVLSFKDEKKFPSNTPESKKRIQEGNFIRKYFDENQKREMIVVYGKISVQKRKNDFEREFGVKLSRTKGEIKSALEQGKYQQAILEGRMTADDAKTIIESAGLEVPKDILEMAHSTEPYSEDIGKAKGGKILPKNNLKGFIIKENSDSPNYKKAVKFAIDNDYTLKSDVSYNGYIFIEKLLKDGNDKIEIQIYDGIKKDKAPQVEVLSKEANFGNILDETKYRFAYTGFHKKWDDDWRDIKNLEQAFKYAIKLEKNINKDNEQNTMKFNKKTDDIIDSKKNILAIAKQMGEGVNRVKIIEVPVEMINTDVSRFQNRKTEYSQKTVDSIVNDVKDNNFNWGIFDAILLWYNTNDNKLYVLIGHSRTQAFKQLSSMGYEDFKTIPAKIITTDSIKKAEEIAIDSNVKADREQVTERVKRYRKLLKDGMPYYKVKELATKNEGRGSASNFMALSYLNPKGKIINLLSKYESGETSKNTENIQTISKYVGEARSKFSQLTDSHEDELFDWLVFSGALNKIKRESEFLDRVGNIISRFDFNPNEPLNIAQKETKTNYDVEYEKKEKELIDEIEKKRDLIDSKVERYIKANIVPEKIAELLDKDEAELSVLRKKLIQHQTKGKEQVIQANKQTLSLFDDIPIADTNKSFKNDFNTKLTDSELNEWRNLAELSDYMLTQEFKTKKEYNEWINLAELSKMMIK